MTRAAELRSALDDVDVAVDLDPEWHPRLYRLEVIDDEGDSGIGTRVDELEGLLLLEPTDVETLAVELVDHRRHVGLEASRRCRRETRQALRSDVGDLRLREH